MWSCFKCCLAIPLVIATLICGALLKNRNNLVACHFQLGCWWQREYDPKVQLVNDFKFEQTVLITGGNRGLGLQSAKYMAERNANVIITCRTDAKCEKAKAEIMEYYPQGKVSYYVNDIESMVSMDQLIASLNEDLDSLEMVMINACTGGKYGVAEDTQVTLTFQGVYASQAYLLEKLVPLMEKADQARVSVVALSWGAEMFDKTGFADEEFELSFYLDRPFVPKNGVRDKLFQYFHARSLHNRLRARGVNNILINALDPGQVTTGAGPRNAGVIHEMVKNGMDVTDLKDAMGPMAQNWIWENEVYVERFITFFEFVTKSFHLAWLVEDAAYTQVHAVAGKDIIENNISGEILYPIGLVYNGQEEYKAGWFYEQLDSVGDKVWKLTAEFIDHWENSCAANEA